MKKTTAIQRLMVEDKHGRYVFGTHALKKLFHEDKNASFHQGINRLISAGYLKRACRGIFVNEQAHSFDSFVIEHIAKEMRRGEYNYISLESALSEYGLISQIPIDRLTVMTTGRSGLYNTPYGSIEFTHTKRTADSIIDAIQSIAGRPLRIATQPTAIRDLKRVGRNCHLLTKETPDD